jgi:hypothetical protein
MTYPIVSCTVIGMDPAEHAIPLLLFTGRYLVGAVAYLLNLLSLLSNVSTYLSTIMNVHFSLKIRTVNL